MANIKSEEKRIRTRERNHEINNSRKSELKTAMKKVEAAAKASKKAEAEVALKEAISLLDRYSQLGTITLNSAKRKKSYLTRLVNSIE